jgi:hypothetical protein
VIIVAAADESVELAWKPTVLSCFKVIFKKVAEGGIKELEVVVVIVDDDALADMTLVVLVPLLTAKSAGLLKLSG